MSQTDVESTGAIAAPELLEVRQERHFLSRAWSLYLVLAVALVPIVLPVGPSQIVSVDLVNAAALAVFMITILTRRLPLRLPFALPMFIAIVGSVLAMSNAVSVMASVLALIKDAYLYLWFAAMVTVLQPRGTMRNFRLAWVWTAIGVSLVVYVQAAMSGELSLRQLLVTNRERSVGTMTNSNMFADYMMFSMFVLLSLVNQVRWRFLVPAMLLVLSALITTKSNGGLVSLMSGLAVWGVATAWRRGIPWQRLAGTIVLGIAVVATGVWLHGEFGIGDSLVREVTAHSYVGRMSHSGAARGQIWHRLEETYAHSPLGIGPKNSSEQTVSIGERERPDSFRSKEAHNDYLAFAVERGPLGLLGLLLGTWQAIAMVVRGRRRLDLRFGGVVAGRALWTAFLGALVASSVHSLVIEKLHFRHFWLFLAMATAACLEAVPAAAPVPRRAPTPLRQTDGLSALRG